MPNRRPYKFNVAQDAWWPYPRPRARACMCSAAMYVMVTGPPCGHLARVSLHLLPRCQYSPPGVHCTEALHMQSLAVVARARRRRRRMYPPVYPPSSGSSVGNRFNAYVFLPLRRRVARKRDYGGGPAEGAEREGRSTAGLRTMGATGKCPWMGGAIRAAASAGCLVVGASAHGGARRRWTAAPVANDPVLARPAEYNAPAGEPGHGLPVGVIG